MAQGCERVCEGRAGRCDLSTALWWRNWWWRAGSINAAGDSSTTPTLRLLSPAKEEAKGVIYFPFYCSKQTTPTLMSHWRLTAFICFWSIVMHSAFKSASGVWRKETEQMVFSCAFSFLGLIGSKTNKSRTLFKLNFGRQLFSHQMKVFSFRLLSGYAPYLGPRLSLQL